MLRNSHRGSTTQPVIVRAQLVHIGTAIGLRRDRLTFADVCTFRVAWPIQQAEQANEYGQRPISRQQSRTTQRCGGPSRNAEERTQGGNRGLYHGLRRRIAYNLASVARLGGLLGLLLLFLLGR